MPKQLGTLAVGEKVKDSTTKYYDKPIIWKVADKNHSGYPANSVTLITDRIISLKCFDGTELSNSDKDRKAYGNSRYVHSNIRQWLNSPAPAGAWYVAQHSADTPPNISYTDQNPYDMQAGFLNTFSSNFSNALLTATLIVAKNKVTEGGGYETFSDKLFLASNTEAGLANENNIVEGAKLALFSDNGSRVATLTAEAVSNGGNGSAKASWQWWLRTPNAAISCYPNKVIPEGTLSSDGAYNGTFGVRPLCNLKSSILVSDTTDSDGCYTIVWNRAPEAPTVINVPNEIIGGKSINVSWAAAADSDGNLAGYELERSVNGGSFAQIYRGTATSFANNITYGWANVAFRVRAYDSAGEYSPYKASAAKNVTNNAKPNKPTLIFPLVNMRVGQSDEVIFTPGTDAENDNQQLAVEIADNPEFTLNKQTFSANMQKENGGAWENVSFANNADNGRRFKIPINNLSKTEFKYLHLTSVDATGSGFVTLGDAVKIRIGKKLEFKTLAKTLDYQPKSVSVVLGKIVDAKAEIKVFVCNNALDALPAWEDMTEKYLSGGIFALTNKTKTAASWAVGVKVVILAKEAVGEISVSSIGIGVV